ncbi:MAG TPA: serine/threonine-protein kinase [Bryobacteraceae bacterium]|nr:serine/threonine-protein kinase [Bryobacteraceae bacterium]
MEPERWREIERLYHEALEREALHRAAWVKRAAHGDESLEQEVLSLLAESDDKETFLEEPALQVAARTLASSSAAPAYPARIGRYRILELLGEGGMGAVYEAEQDEPRRVVALKVIRLGLATPERLRRFRQESQALARLQHPGIAQIYESGEADTGFGPQPYFAMELIRGLPLHEYAEAHRLDLRQKLAIVGRICDAVHHAHQRGLIHRDLKPGNILVDENGQPKVLDFGVARVTETESLETTAQPTIQTGLGQLVGTLAYMSPEQVHGDPAGVDSRSDVYSLGVILYQLLAGRLPYEIDRGHIAEAAQTIREEDPAPLRSIERKYRGDAETIVRKALEKDKARRYTSAAELAADIQHYLNDEPIAARPPSVGYQLLKFARRNRGLAAGAAAVFVVLMAGIAASTSQAIRASRAEIEARLDGERARAAEKAATHDRDRELRAEHAASEERNRALAAEAEAVRERNRAVAAEARAVSERNQALAEKRRADSEAATAKAVNDFLRNDVLAQANLNNQASPNTKPDPDLTVRTALDRAAAGIGGKFEKQPLVEASIRQTIGNAYLDLGSYPKALEQLERTVEIRRRALGESDNETLMSMNNLAVLYLQQGDAPRAEPLFARILEARRRLLGEENADTLVSMNNLAAVYRTEGKYAQAEPILIKALDIKRRVLGEVHHSTATAWNNLASVYRLEGKLSEAEPLQLKAVEVWRAVSGEEGPETLTSMSSLAALYQAQKRYPEAEELWSKVLESLRRTLGAKHPNAIDVMNSLGEVRIQQEKYALAESLIRESLGTVEAAAPNTWKRYYAQALLGASLAGQKRFSEAEPLLLSGHRGLRDRQSAIPAGTRRVVDETGQRIAELYKNWGQPDKALAWQAQYLGK